MCRNLNNCQNIAFNATIEKYRAFWRSLPNGGIIVTINEDIYLHYDMLVFSGKLLPSLSSTTNVPIA
jgi:hypothetical protein